jgi:predicted nucleic acid-binding protein
MLVTVKDTCILIDLVNGGLLGRWFQLGIETHTTDAVLFEIEREDQSREVTELVKAGLLKVSPTYEEKGTRSMQAVYEASEEMRVSFPDASAYLLATTLEAVLLTGDGTLRKGATERGLQVCGVLWILDMLLWNEVIDFQTADRSLRAMLEHAARLPSSECERRLNSWSKSRKIRPRRV